ncbi:Zn-dependent hydrolase [Vallitalea longa]|uniref:Zn-dependent hydrolase n=1 Tax=Vallitalea longa TaxID=2936439 RepID=A0A9W5YDK4_9FIRM|nr:MBL fold metallo-hydrolase [Vallitalea longa]GKX30671.1 Zn-dependent hydrolase [Vallitalea longa]
MLNKLTDRVYYMPHSEETDRPSLGLICGSKYSLVVDSGNSPRHAKEFLSEIESMDIPPLKYLVITHNHWDHVFGIREMGLVTIANCNTKDTLEESKKLKWDDEALEEYINDEKFSEFTVNCIKKEITDRDNFQIGDLDITYKDCIEIDLGDVTCIIEAVGGDHTDDASIVYVPEERVIFLGDCIYGGMYQGEYGYTKEKLFPMIDKIQKYEADYFIISHEEISNRDKINELWTQLKITGQIAEDDSCIEQVTKRFSDTLNRKPSEDEEFYLNCFVNVNKITH